MGRPTIKRVEDTAKLLCPRPSWKPLATIKNVSCCPYPSPLLPVDWCSCHTLLPCQAWGHSGSLGGCLHHQTPRAQLRWLITGTGTVTAVPSVHSWIPNPPYSDGVLLFHQLAAVETPGNLLSKVCDCGVSDGTRTRAKASKTFVTSLNLRCHFGDYECLIQTPVQDTPWPCWPLSSGCGSHHLDLLG